MSKKHPLNLRSGDRIIVNGETYEVQALRDSIVNSRTKLPDVAIDLVDQDWSIIVPREARVEVEA